MDARVDAIKFGGYHIGHSGGHLTVRIELETHQELKAYYLDLACRRSRDKLIEEFYWAPFEPYAGVRRQMFNILRGVNKRRRTAGYDKLPNSCIWLKRRIVKPFGPVEDIRLFGQAA